MKLFVKKTKDLKICIFSSNKKIYASPNDDTGAVAYLGARYLYDVDTWCPNMAIGIYVIFCYKMYIAQKWR